MKDKIKVLMKKVKDLFTKSQWEGIKRVARFLIFFLMSGVVTQMLNQIANVPDFVFFNVWVFKFSVAIRSSLKIALTLALSYLDTKRHVDWKLKYPTSVNNGGLIKW